MVAAASSSAISVAAIFPAVLIGLVYLTRRSLSSGLRVNDMLPFNQMSLDSERRLLTVGAGARWADIVPFLDHQGLAVAVMQSNNDFTVGGSLSVNCHGRQHNSRPIASTVESFRLAAAAGRAHLGGGAAHLDARHHGGSDLVLSDRGVGRQLPRREPCVARRSALRSIAAWSGAEPATFSAEI